MSSEMPIEAIDVALSGDEPLSAKVRKPYTITKQREKWTETEHLQFIEALKLHGRAWRRIEDHIGTKTAVQIRSHAQKFFSKVEREAGTLQDIEVPPPRPKRKPSHPYPRKAASGFSEETKSSPTFTAAYSSNLTPMASPDTSVITEQPKLAQDEEYSTLKTSEAKLGSIESLSSFRIFGQTLHIREAKEVPKGSSSSSSSVIIEESGNSGIVNLKLSLATAASLGTKGTKAAQTLTPPTTTGAQLSSSEEGEEEEGEARNFLVYHPCPVPSNGSTKRRVGVGVGGEALSRSGSCFKPWQPSKGETQRGPGAESQYPCPQLLLPCPYFPTLFHIDGITALQVVSSWPSLISNPLPLPLPLSSVSLPHSSLEDQNHLPNRASASSSSSPSNSIYSETTEASESYSPCSSQGSLNEHAREINNDPQTMPPSPSKRVRTCNEGKGENR